MEKKFIPVMITPFQAEGLIDYKALASLIDWYLEAGALGLFANCLSSEMYELSETERLELVKFIVDHAGPNVPVVATGTFGGSLASQAEFIKRIHGAGAQAVIINTNMVAEEKASGDEVDKAVMQLIELTKDIPLGFYECPVPFKRLLSAGQLAKYCESGRISYHKDTSCKLQQVEAKLSAVSKVTDSFGLYDAYMGHFRQSLSLGAAGLSCIQGNYWPDLVAWICKNHEDPSCQVELELVQQFLNRNMDVVHDGYPHTIKYYMRKSGLPIDPYVRQAIKCDFSSMKQEMDILYDEYEALERRLQLQVTR